METKKYLSHFLSEDSLIRTTILKYFTSTLTVELTKVKFVYINPMSEYEPSSDRTSNPTALQCNLISATSLKLPPRTFPFEYSMRLMTPSVF